jgi:hypothetical protein
MKQRSECVLLEVHPQWFVTIGTPTVVSNKAQTWFHRNDEEENDTICLNELSTKIKTAVAMTNTTPYTEYLPFRCPLRHFPPAHC